MLIKSRVVVVDLYILHSPGHLDPFYIVIRKSPSAFDHLLDNNKQKSFRRTISISDPKNQKRAEDLIPKYNFQ